MHRYPEEVKAHLDNGALAAFLQRVDGLMEEALQQNEAGLVLIPYSGDLGSSPPGVIF